MFASILNRGWIQESVKTQKGLLGFQGQKWRLNDQCFAESIFTLNLKFHMEPMLKTADLGQVHVYTEIF